MLEISAIPLQGVPDVREVNLIDLLLKFHDSLADIIRTGHGISKDGSLNSSPRRTFLRPRMKMGLRKFLCGRGWP